MTNDYQKIRLLEEMKAMYNHICIVADSDLVRLIGLGEDDSDYYWIGLSIGGKRRWYSCVGPCESLKGKLERYDQIDTVFSLNNAGPTDMFLVLRDGF